MENQQLSKGRKITGWVLAGLLTALLVMSAIGKLSGGAEMVANFDKWGLNGKLMLIGIGELIAALLFIIPRTSSLGVLLLSAHLGGAIATHMQHGEMFIPQTVILAVIWITAWVRNPNTLSSFKK